MPAKTQKVACKNIESSLENDRKVPCEVKSSTAFVKSPTVINKSASVIDKSATVICLFQNIIVTHGVRTMCMIIVRIFERCRRDHRY